MDNWKLKIASVLNHTNAFIPIIAIVLSLLIGSLPIIFADKNPFDAFLWLLFGAGGNPIRLGATLTRATPILLTGLAATISFRSGVFNVGLEGQLYMGALGASFVALYIPPLPAFFHISLCLIVAMVFGAIWSLIPGVLKAYKNVDEVIVTIMMNFIAFWIVSYLVHGPMREEGAMFSNTAKIPDSAVLPILLKGTQLHLGFILALIVAFFVYILLNKSSLGYQMRAVGGNIEAAHYSGIDTKRVLLAVFWISGAIVGIAGALEILGVQYRLSDYFSPGYGWDGIAVALVGNTTVGGVIFASLFFALLRSGAGEMERRMGVPSAIGTMIQGLAVFFTILGITFQSKLQQNKTSKKTILPDIRIKKKTPVR